MGQRHMLKIVFDKGILWYTLQPILFTLRISCKAGISFSKVFFSCYTILLPNSSTNAISDNDFLTLGVKAFSFNLSGNT